ncbi:MAG: tRNA (N(6)-L-threonylcarbamoyladenosine(37)-C(2))-methylthiotransferase MtaB [Clostridia bacterium]|nr:tRNA (N(6)-L-threonylcarbamoyladenosine(37)-C(2))-methylthiotransferase MtaB [Clostridia bacterium]
MKDKPTAAVLTLGCKVNQYESVALTERLAALGFEIVGGDDAADVYIVNTCAVTAEAERKSRNLARRCIRRNPSASVIVMGCASETSPEEMAKIEGVRHVFGTKDKLSAANVAAADVAAAADIASEKSDNKGAAVIHVNEGEVAALKKIEPMKITSSPRTRAYVKICDGCGGKCAYCIIPRARGPVRSRMTGDIIDEVRGLAAAGVREVVFTGIETADFGRDTGEDLISLLAAASDIYGLDRIRLSSLEPTIFTPEFAAAVAEIPKIAPHFHVSLQSGCDRTLHAMKRRYGTERVLESIAFLREKIPDLMLSADMIVGFPGETEEDFAETLEFIKRFRPLHLHVFPFSRRRGTVAETMENQVPETVKHERSARLISLGERLRDEEIASYLERTEVTDVLFEADASGMHSGHTENFVEVRTAPTGASVTGQILPVKLECARDGVVYGRALIPDSGANCRKNS